MSFVPFPITPWRLAMLAAALGFIASAQRPRPVDDALLKAGSKTGESGSATASTGPSGATAR